MCIFKQNWIEPNDCFLLFCSARTLSDFLPPLLQLSASPIHSVRVMASKALVAMTPPSEYMNILIKLTGQLPRTPERCCHNRLHGQLLQIKAVLDKTLCTDRWDFKAELVYSFTVTSGFEIMVRFLFTGSLQVTCVWCRAGWRPHCGLQLELSVAPWWEQLTWQWPTRWDSSALRLTCQSSLTSSRMSFEHRNGGFRCVTHISHSNVDTES